MAPHFPAARKSVYRDAWGRAHPAGNAQVSPTSPDRSRASSRPSRMARSASSPIRSRRCSFLPPSRPLSLARRVSARLYAVGNAEGARLAGIRTDLVTTAAHVVCSLSAGVTGLYLASRLRSGAPWIGRDGVYDLESIAVVVTGGTLLAGGRGGVWGTLAGVLLFASLDGAFNMMGVSAYPKLVLRGVIVIAAVAVYTVRMRGQVA